MSGKSFRPRSLWTNGNYALLTFFISLPGCKYLLVPAADQSPPAPEAGGLQRVDRDVASALISLIDERKLQKPSPQDLQETVFRDIIKLTTPEGYRLSIRYRVLGVPLAQALSFSKDPQLQGRLLEAARWTSSPLARAEALLALASLKDPAHLKYFREALLDNSVAIQFAALECLQILGSSEGAVLAVNTANQNWSPLIRVYAAETALRLGDARGRDLLLQFLRDRNWLVRAMSARYLGENGRPEDADSLLSRIGPEQDNKFALAEVCIAALNLLAKKPSTPPVASPPTPTPAPRGGRQNRPIFELEPLVVTAPRLKLPAAQFVDVRIDNGLVRLLEKMAEEPPPDEQVLDPELVDVNNLITPTGFNLKVRYSDISFLLTEGLAGTRNFALVRKLEDVARHNPSPRVRAAALVSLGYDGDRTDLSIFNEALRDPNVVARFGALEALNRLGGFLARSSLTDAAQGDASPALRVFAAQALRRAGDPYGRELLLHSMDDPDYVVRAMSMYYLGEWGEPNDYDRILFKVNGETNNFVVAEGCLALLRLSGN